MKKLLVLASVASVFSVTAAHAQFVGGGAPAGTTAQVFSVPGVAHAPGLSTIFSCTNASGSTANIAVQVFDQNGAQQNASPALAVPPGGTVQFATSGTAPFSADQLLSPVAGFTKGAAKIWASTKLILCSALLVTGAGAMAQLTVAAKTKQKGD